LWLREELAVNLAGIVFAPHFHVAVIQGSSVRYAHFGCNEGVRVVRAKRKELRAKTN
jgi:hypothetical protein